MWTMSDGQYVYIMWNGARDLTSSILWLHPYHAAKFVKFAMELLISNDIGCDHDNRSQLNKMIEA